MDNVAYTTQEIGKRLREARTVLGIIPSGVAGRSDVSGGFLSKLEREIISALIANLIQPCGSIRY